MLLDPGVEEIRFSLQDQNLPSIGAARHGGAPRSPFEFRETLRLLDVIPTVRGRDIEPRLDGESRISEAYSREREQLKRFLAKERDPEAWFRESFGFSSHERMHSIVAPLALIFVVEAIPFNNFVNRHGLYFPPNYVIGTNLQAHDRLPEELHGKVIAVSQGDPIRLIRPEEEIDRSVKHEYLHVLNNRVVSPAPFISEPELRARLLRCYDYPFLEPYAALARELGQGMFEHARSEIVSYAGTGDFSISSDSIHSFFWAAHFEALQSIVTTERYASDFRRNIFAEFQRAHAEYRDDVRSLYRMANMLPRENGSLTAESIAHLMLHERSELNPNSRRTVSIAA